MDHRPGVPAKVVWRVTSRTKKQTSPCMNTCPEPHVPEHRLAISSPRNSMNNRRTCRPSQGVGHASREDFKYAHLASSARITLLGLVKPP